MGTIVDMEDMGIIDPIMVDGEDFLLDALPMVAAEVVFHQVPPHPEHERPLVLEVLDEDNQPIYFLLSGQIPFVPFNKKIYHRKNGSDCSFPSYEKGVSGNPG